jgi:hypothetical protein
MENSSHRSAYFKGDFQAVLRAAGETETVQENTNTGFDTLNLSF